VTGNRGLRAARTAPWRAICEELRASALRGALPDDEHARRMARFGIAGLASARPAWQVVARQAPEPRWTGGDPRLAALDAAYALARQTPQ
jgi:hypothetical protein